VVFVVAFFVGIAIVGAVLQWRAARQERSTEPPPLIVPISESSVISEPVQPPPRPSYAALRSRTVATGPHGAGAAPMETLVPVEIVRDGNEPNAGDSFDEPDYSRTGDHPNDQPSPG
jgi:hypothetical protein